MSAPQSAHDVHLPRFSPTRLGPVLKLQTAYAPELARIVRHQSQAEAARVRCDEKIVGSNDGSSSLQSRPNLSIVVCRLAWIIKNFNIAQVFIERRAILWTTG